MQNYNWIKLLVTMVVTAGGGYLASGNWQGALAALLAGVGALHIEPPRQ